MTAAEFKQTPSLTVLFITDPEEKGLKQYEDRSVQMNTDF